MRKSEPILQIKILSINYFQKLVSCALVRNIRDKLDAVPVQHCSDQMPIKAIVPLVSTRGRLDPLKPRFKREIIEREELEEG